MASVLLIEDEDDFASFVSTALVGSGHKVSRIESARNAAEMLRAEKFGLLITDIVMPEKNGLELISELRKSGVDIPILAMSGATESALFLRMARHLGAIEVLFKPFSIAELTAAIDSLLNKQRMGPEAWQKKSADSQAGEPS